MSSRLKDLTDRQAALQLRCAVQRGTLAREVIDVEERLHNVDRVTLAAQRVFRNPIVLALGALGLALIGPSRIVRYAGRAAVATSIARQVLGFLRR